MLLNYIDITTTKKLMLTGWYFMQGISVNPLLTYIMFEIVE